MGGVARLFLLVAIATDIGMIVVDIVVIAICSFRTSWNGVLFR